MPAHVLPPSMQHCSHTQFTTQSFGIDGKRRESRQDTLKQKAIDDLGMRPAVAEKRLSLTPNGNVCYQLKTPYSDGTTHVIFEPLDSIARLAALVPKPRATGHVSMMFYAE